MPTTLDGVHRRRPARAGGNRRLLLSAALRQVFRKASHSVVPAEPQRGDEQVYGEATPLLVK